MEDSITEVMALPSSLAPLNPALFIRRVNSGSQGLRPEDGLRRPTATRHPHTRLTHQVNFPIDH